MNKHTPGPWKAFNARAAIYVRQVNGLQITVSTLDVDPWSSGEVQARIEANARLIAACPDLLAAIRELLDMVTDNRTHGPEINRAVAAIAKAEGRAEA